MDAQARATARGYWPGWQKEGVDPRTGEHWCVPVNGWLIGDELIWEEQVPRLDGKRVPPGRWQLLSPHAAIDDPGVWLRVPPPAEPLSRPELDHLYELLETARQVSKDPEGKIAVLEQMTGIAYQLAALTQGSGDTSAAPKWRYQALHHIAESVMWRWCPDVDSLEESATAQAIATWTQMRQRAGEIGDPKLEGWFHGFLNRLISSHTPRDDMVHAGRPGTG